MPALLLFMASIYLKTESEILYYIMLFILAGGVLWNFDSGFVAMAAWVLTLIYAEIADQGISLKSLNNNMHLFKKILKHLTAAFLVFILFIVLYGTVMYLKSGKTPDFIEALKYQNIFYTMGFYMIPMKLIHEWNIYAIVASFGVAASVGFLLFKHKKQKDVTVYKILFLLSVLSVGLFSYYQGRSHELNIVLISYLPFLIVLISVDFIYSKIQAEHSVKKTNLSNILVFVTLMFFLSSPFADMVSSNTFAKMNDFIKRQKEVYARNPSSEGIEFAKKVLNKGEPVLIISKTTGMYYAESKTYNPLDVPGMAELLLRKDYDKILEYAKKYNPGMKLMIDRSWMKNIEINPGYVMKAASPTGDFILYEQPGDEQIDNMNEYSYLKSGRSILQIKRIGYSVYSRVLNNKLIGLPFASDIGIQVNAKNNYGFDIVFKPAQGRDIFYEITGNFDGKTGFSLRQNNYMPSDGYVSVVVGTDTGVVTSGRIKIDLNAWNYLSVEIYDKKLKFILNGIDTYEELLNGKFINSESGLRIGVGFAGEISDLSVFKLPREKDEIIENYYLIRDIIGKENITEKEVR